MPENSTISPQQNNSENSQREESMMRWQIGDWAYLSNLDDVSIAVRPDRALLATLKATALFQQGELIAAHRLAVMALDWGIEKKEIGRTMISGAYNTLGRLALLNGLNQQAEIYIKEAVCIAAKESNGERLYPERLKQQIIQINSKLNFINTGFSSKEYWESRYSQGGDSGYGSYGILAKYKASIINKWIAEKNIEEVIEFGCGDGNQLSMFKVSKYIGVDVSAHIINQCKKKFSHDKSKQFYNDLEFNSIQPRPKADLVLSLDVIYHVVEDENFSAYMFNLFDTAKKFCVIYSCNEHEDYNDSAHLRRRKFTDWIEKNISGWDLSMIIFNDRKYAKTHDPKNSSISDFYFYTKTKENK